MHESVEYEQSRLKGKKEAPTPALYCKPRTKVISQCSNLLVRNQ